LSAKSLFEWGNLKFSVPREGFLKKEWRQIRTDSLAAGPRHPEFRQSWLCVVCAESYGG